jgi:hypothetical protein
MYSTTSSASTIRNAGTRTIGCLSPMEFESQVGLAQAAITQPGAGQIESVPANILNNLNTTIPGFDFFQTVFNPGATANGSANITAFNQVGTQFSFLFPSVERLSTFAIYGYRR